MKRTIGARSINRLVSTKRLVDGVIFMPNSLTFTCNDALFILIVRCARAKEIVKSYVREQGMCHLILSAPFGRVVEFGLT